MRITSLAAGVILAVSLFAFSPSKASAQYVVPNTVTVGHYGGYRYSAPRYYTPRYYSPFANYGVPYRYGYTPYYGRGANFTFGYNSGFNNYRNFNRGFYPYGFNRGFYGRPGVYFGLNFR